MAHRLLLAALPGLVLAAPMLVPASAHAERPAQIDTTRTQPLMLQWRYSRGQSALYTLQASTNVEDLRQSDTVQSSANGQTIVRTEVQNVDAQGKATLALSLSDPGVTLTSPRRDDTAANVQNVLRGTRITFQANPDGSVQERTGLPTTDRTHPNLTAWIADVITLAWIQFPVEPIRVGESWVQLLPMAQDSGSDGRINATFTIEYTFAGYALWGGREHAVIDARYRSSLQGSVPFGTTTDQTSTLVGRGDGEGYLLFDASNGSLSELGLRHGFVLTQTDPTTLRSTRTMMMNATMSRRASVEAAAAEGETTP